jgi:hypothetical protein
MKVYVPGTVQLWAVCNTCVKGGVVTSRIRRLQGREDSTGTGARKFQSLYITCSQRTVLISVQLKICGMPHKFE